MMENDIRHQLTHWTSVEFLLETLSPGTDASLEPGISKTQQDPFVSFWFCIEFLLAFFHDTVSYTVVRATHPKKIGLRDHDRLRRCEQANDGW